MGLSTRPLDIHRYVDALQHMANRWTWCQLQENSYEIHIPTILLGVQIKVRNLASVRLLEKPCFSGTAALICKGYLLLNINDSHLICCFKCKQPLLLLLRKFVEAPHACRRTSILRSSQVCDGGIWWLWQFRMPWKIKMEPQELSEKLSTLQAVQRTGLKWLPPMSTATLSVSCKQPNSIK